MAFFPMRFIKKKTVSKIYKATGISFSWTQNSQRLQTTAVSKSFTLPDTGYTFIGCTRTGFSWGSVIPVAITCSVSGTTATLTVTFMGIDNNSGSQSSVFEAYFAKDVIID